MNSEGIRTLALIADQRIELTVIEELKTLGLPADLTGDLETENVLFRDTSRDEIMNGLEQFLQTITPWKVSKMD